MKTKDEMLKELEDQLVMEKMVKKGEVGLNKNLREENEKLKLHIETLVEINENYATRLAKLRAEFKKFIDNI
jgi:chaperonin cofactor prefoldin